MSRYIATRALRGANMLVKEFDEQLQKALTELGPDKEIKFTNTAYYLPIILGYTGIEVETLGGLKPVLEHCRTLLHSAPEAKTWVPYLGETLDAGMATFFAEEIIEVIRYLEQPDFYTKGEDPTDSNIWLGATDDVILRKSLNILSGLGYGIEAFQYLSIDCSPGIAACPVRPLLPVGIVSLARNKPIQCLNSFSSQFVLVIHFQRPPPCLASNPKTTLSLSPIPAP